jgi:hypothetical protein
MSLLGRLLPPSLTPTAQAIYGTVAIGVVSGPWHPEASTEPPAPAAAVLCAAALPLIAALQRKDSPLKRASSRGPMSGADLSEPAPRTWGADQPYFGGRLRRSAMN